MTAFTVHAPPDTPPWEPLFLAGAGPALGDWCPHALPLTRGDDGVYRGNVELPAGRAAEVLVTRGRWRVAETDSERRERPPRVVPADARSVELTVQGWCRDSVRYHHNVQSEFLPHDRTLTVALPPGYDGRRRFPVAYLQDGQNLFDAATSFAGTAWRCDEAAERAARGGRCAPVILVGVANTPDRIAEYGPRRGGSDAPDDLSRRYARFLVEEVKPFVDREYATLPGPADTAVGGSSLGGTIALHLAKWHPDVFGRCAALSPSLWWDREHFLRSVETGGDWLAGCRLWLDMGDREGLTAVTQQAGVRRARRLAGLLARPGRKPGGGFTYREVPGGEHNEWHWGERFADVLAFLFPPLKTRISELGTRNSETGGGR